MHTFTVRRLLAAGLALVSAFAVFTLIPTAAASADPSANDWYGVRMCEASNNYRVVDGSGTHFGAYQFDQTTWESVGGHGPPNLSSPAEQDNRALYLYRLRGWQPWQCA
ncbi:MAG: transglycosylase family protein, partial [Mycobacteriaceae bacterium]